MYYIFLRQNDHALPFLSSVKKNQWGRWQEVGTRVAEYTDTNRFFKAVLRVELDLSSHES